ncbi:bifunctional metallophosphatase/5'-nucleotidase [Pseudomonas abieticivorans]|uniref:bifunctional metallophosphatase/5'-nucleotidase n=1 Tax=Pseudomonas abieticivorans TaxID=2931382 RepID=UPI0020C167F7|nr:bifunctional metallophosphatase/5'-nucleotidase [Pseudomonas sp. PIA16]
MSSLLFALRRACLLAPTALVLGACSHAVAPPATVQVNIAAVNDFHGNLLATPLSYPDPSAPKGKVVMKAGGIDALSGVVAQLRQQDPNLVLIGAGDMIGGSPPISSMWADEPTLQALGLLGMKFSTVGNHELDQGTSELQRQIHGGCDSPRPDKACQFDKTYSGAGFPYIAANLIDTHTGKPLFAPYQIEQVNGVKVAFVGAVLRDVASVVSNKSMQGLSTTDEALAINAQLPALHEQGVDAVVAVIHQGGETPERFDQADCSQLTGDIVDVAQRLAPEIKVVITAHTHQGYLCQVGDKLVTQGASYGRLLTYVTLTIDPAKHQLLGAKARNIVVDPKLYKPMPQIAALQAQVEQRSQALLGKPVARIATRELTRHLSPAGESAMGDLVADGQLAATRSLGAQVAFTNLGGIRTDLILEPGQAQLTFGQVASVQPFNNTLNILTLTGAQIHELIEQQWQSGSMGFYPLQPSSSLRYRWDASRPAGQRVIAQSLTIDGKPVLANQTYQVTVNSFMAEGGDNFSVLAKTSKRLDTGLNDLEALIGYLQAQDKAGTPAGVAGAPRIQRDGQALSAAQP